MVCISLSFSIYLAREFAFTSKDLERKLQEVQQLSTQNETLEKLVNERTAELKASQNQLIQKEKLASLGELTAGIAHEIQNPLNFVNNFSELTIELIEESLAAATALPPDGGTDESWIPDTPFGGWGAFWVDLKQNLGKINHHGKRAASIVSSMLEHSRTSTGERVMTDINKLADEYLRLSYHGMRAKNKDFSADYELITDKDLPLVNVVPQDIGKVLLNLINNTFQSQAPRAKKPHKVIVKTFKIEANENSPIGAAAVAGWGASVSDNGSGMSKEVKEKIFQPFFTTKPTGEGTGLGLSLVYDIVTKGHGGTIEVESQENEGTTFVVKLPIA